MLVWLLLSLTYHLITTSLLFKSLVSAESPQILKADQSTFTIAQGILTLSECQHVIITENSELLAQTGLMKILHGTQLPVEVYCNILPHGDPQNHIRRHRSHCLVRSLLLSSFVMSYDIALFIRTVKGDFTWDKEKDIILLFQPFSLLIPLPENQTYMRFCELPLNFLVVFYDKQNLMITSQRAVKQCCEHGKLVCFFEWNVLGQKISFEEISGNWKRLRSQFNGCRVTYDEPGIVATWKEMNFLREQPLYLYHQNAGISIFQLLYIFQEKLNVTLDAHRTTGSSSDENSYIVPCSTTFIVDRYQPIIRKIPGAAWNMHLAGVRWYQAFYTEDDRDTKAPYRLQSTLYPSETKVWLLLLLCIVVWTLVSIILIGKKADKTAVFLAVLTPFTAQLFPYVAIEKLKMWFTLWVACSIILLVTYGNTVTSLTTVPTAKTGTKTVTDLMEQNYSTSLSFAIHALWATGTHSSVVAPGTKFYDLELKFLEYLKKFREDMEVYPSPREFYSNSNNFEILEDWLLPVFGTEIANLVKKNVHVVKEQLFQSVNWWSTHFMPNSDVATWQFHLMRAVGFVDYWKRIQMEAYLERAKEGFRQLAAQDGRPSDFDGTSFAGTLAESLIQESFIIWMYGLALSLITFVFEVMPQFIEVSVERVDD